MGTQHTTIAPADVVAVFDRQERSGTPLTTAEVGESVGCARRTAYKKLDQLAEEGALETKKVGARGRVWWRPPSRRGVEPGTIQSTDSDHRRFDRRAHERALRELHEATRRLIHAETHEVVCEIAVAAAQRILGLSLCGLWLATPDRAVLEPVAWTEPGVEEYGEPPAFPVDESLVGHAFRQGDYRVYDDITTEEDIYDPETRVRSELILPLGEHGVLNASSPDVGAFDEVDVSLGRILAANVQTALDRADHLEERRQRRRTLERQRDELEQLTQINTLIEDTIAALVEAATRDEIEQIVCNRLAASEFYLDAWVAERRSESGSINRRTDLDDDGDVSGSTPVPEESLPSSNPIQTVLDDRTLEVIPLPGEATDGGIEHGTTDATDESQACLLVPLTHADTVFGALVVHAPGADDFRDRELTAFETLGRVVGFSINATNNRQLLLGNTAVEITVAIRDTDAWFVTAARTLDATVTVEGLVPTDTGTLIEYVSVAGFTDDGDPTELAESPAVVDVRVLAEDDDRWYLECLVREDEARLKGIAEYGAAIRTARANGETGSVTTRFPSTASPREAMEVITEAFPDAELVAKRVVDTSDQSVSTIRQAVADRLTEKQLQALRAAVLAGYFDSPRGTTAQELAGSLNIAPSTFHQHMQAAHRKVLGTVFPDLVVS